MFWLVSLSCLGGASLGVLVPQVRAVLGSSLQLCLAFLALWGAGEVGFRRAVAECMAVVAAHQFGFLVAAFINFSWMRRAEWLDVCASSDVEALNEVATRMRESSAAEADRSEIARAAERLRNAR